MIGEDFSATSMLPDPATAFHSYGTACPESVAYRTEGFRIEMLKFRPWGDPTEAFRISSGLYSTGESAVWTLPAEHLRRFIQLQSLAERLPLAALFQMLMVHPEQRARVKDRRAELLERIRARRRAIEQQRGVLRESYFLIREDRER